MVNWKRILMTAVSIGVISCLAACAPTIKQVPDELIAKEDYKRGFDDGMQKGFDAAMTTCRAEYSDRMTEMYENFKEHVLYLSLVKGGVLEPAKVAMKYMPGERSQDKSSYTPPSIKWEVLAPPKFTIYSQEWFMKDAENFCYIFLKKYHSKRQAIEALAALEKPQSLSILSDVVSYSNNSNEFAIILKTSQRNCDTVIRHFGGQGYSPLGILPR